MNEQVQKWLVETFGQAKDFAIEQSPDVVRQVLQFSALQAFVVAVSFLLAAAIAATVARYGYVRYKIARDTEKWGNTEGPGAAAIIGSVLSAMFTVFALCSFVDFAHVYFFPKSYLLSLVLK